jgi:ubiquinone/menaquinone biosynthesis C-methylase UbiE
MQFSTSLVQQRVNQHFSAEALYWADVYDAARATSVIYTRRHDIALSWIEQLRLPASSPVLEVGCGAGRLAGALARRGLCVTATDSNLSMIRLARSYATRLSVEERLSTPLADAHELPFPSETFALIVALGVLPWLQSMRTALREMRRVLRQGGHAVLTCDNLLRLDYFVDPRNNFLLRPLRRRIKSPLVRSGLLRETPNFQGNMLSRDQFAALLEEAGFEVLALAPCGYGPFTFFGRRFLPARASTAAQLVQQQLAERGAPVIRSCPNQFVALCRVRAQERAWRGEC